MTKIRDNSAKEEPIEKQLWKAADKLRKNIDAAEYKHIVLGLKFLNIKFFEVPNWPLKMTKF